MDERTLETCYRLIAELLLYPEDRHPERVEALWGRIGRAPAPVREALQRFLAEPAGRSLYEYIQTVELSPPCPLYLGSYLFDEPTSCRGAGLSGRNRYMLELKNIYRHFGFELVGGELPDFLPIMVDFLWISLGRRERGYIGLRRHFLEHYLAPALEPLHARLSEYESVYALLIEALGWAAEVDLERMADIPAWVPPPEGSEPRSVPTTRVRSFDSGRFPVAEEVAK